VTRPSWCTRNDEPRLFFGTLVDTAISTRGGLASESKAAWAVDFIEISRDGITQERFASLDQLRVSAEQEASV